MGAILGRLALNGASVAAQPFETAFDALRPARCLRSDLHLAGPVALGHHCTGLSDTGPQPLSEGACTIVADARLYNRAELAQALGGDAGGMSDVALILQAYLRWGAACLEHINGDFGFAIHDRDRNALFLARDHIGARPLYWTRRGDDVMFATLIPGLTAFPDQQWSANELRIARYLRNPTVVFAESFFDGVEIVEPGHWVRIDAAQVTRHRWWDPRRVPRREGVTLEEARAKIRALTEAAVRARLITSAPVGAHCSGGIDSTLVTILASKQLRETGSNLAGAYAWSPEVTSDYPDMGDGDERRVITQACSDLGVPVRFGSATAETFKELIEQPMEQNGFANLLDELPIIARAREDGIAVMLSGWGGDEVFSSHARGHLAWLWKNGRKRRVLGVFRRAAGGLRHPRRIAALFWSHIVVPRLPDALYKYFTPFKAIYEDGAFPSPALAARALDVPKVYGPRLRPDAGAQAALLVLMGHIGDRMATWTAWSAPAGFEYRYPLTDRHLMEYMLSLPNEIQFGNGAGRFHALRSFTDILPKGLKKDDLANEKLRADNRERWLALLQADLAAGKFDAPCPWLDMTAFRRTMSEPLPEDKIALLRTFARLFAATRIYHVHARMSARTQKAHDAQERA